MNENQQEMYQYLLDHAYVSHTKKDPFRQREMTKQRAKCIACKCGNMIDKKTKELQERIDEAIEYIETTTIITAGGRKTTIDDVGYGRKLLSILKGDD